MKIEIKIEIEIAEMREREGGNCKKQDIPLKSLFYP